MAGEVPDNRCVILAINSPLSNPWYKKKGFRRTPRCSAKAFLIDGSFMYILYHICRLRCRAKSQAETSRLECNETIFAGSWSNKPQSRSRSQRQSHTLRLVSHINLPLVQLETSPAQLTWYSPSTIPLSLFDSSRRQVGWVWCHSQSVETSQSQNVLQDSRSIETS